jgi:Sigma-70 region 2
MALLYSRWALHDVEDAEKLASKVLGDALQARGAFLRPHEREDALSFLLATLWELSERWDAGRGGSFATHAYRTLRLRVVDFYRQEYGRTRWQWSDTLYERERPVSYSLERETGTGGQDPRHGTASQGDIVRGELARAFAAQSSDPADDRDPDLSGLLRGGSRQHARDLDELGIELDGRAA